MATATACTTDDVIYTINYIAALDDPVRKQSGEVTISTESGLFFSGHIEKHINQEFLRWISRCQYTGSPQQPQYCLVVSYLDRSTMLVENIFFETADERKDTFDGCLKYMKDLLVVKCQGCSSDQSRVNDLVSIICSQPIHAGRVEMTVGTCSEVEPQTSEGDLLEFLMLIDLECVCLYRVELVEPVHQLMFWEAESENSIERVKLTHKSTIKGLPEKIVYLQTKTQSFAFNADMEIVQQLQNLIPKKKFLMTDPKLMLRVMPNLKLPQLMPQPNPHWVPHASSSSAAMETDYTATSNNPWTKESMIVNDIHAKLRKAEETFRANEDIQNMWVAIEFDIQEIMDSGTVPSTDHHSGGMDADSEEHLKCALSDVEDQLKENNLPVAISRVQACRQLFGSSNISAIRSIFNKNDTDLLKALYLKTLCD